MYSKIKDFRIHIGEVAPDAVIHAARKKKEKVAITEEATKEEGSEKEKGENPTTEENKETASNAPRPTTPKDKEKEKEKEKEAEPQQKIFDLNEAMQGRDKQDYVFVFFYRDNSDFEDR